jgi:hypothetical protein
MVTWRHDRLSGPDSECSAWAFDEADLRLLAAMAAAAKAAAQVGHERPADGARSLSATKRAVDGAATAAGEELLRYARSRIEIRAGEGLRDDSPGAQLGQVFGADGAARHAVIDYVDGTGLAATGQPNALALGALGEDVSRTPDAKVFTVMGPRDDVSDVELTSPRAAAAQAVQALAGTGAWKGTLRVLTHTTDVGPQRTWYDYLRGLGVLLEVPSPIAVEPPYILSLAREERPTVDCMIGVMGLVELVFASMLLDLLRPEYAFKFRLVGSTNAKDLLSDPPLAYHLGEEDLVVAESGGLVPETEYMSDAFVRPGSATFGAIFAVTASPLLGLPAARPDAVSGLLVRRGGLVGATVTYYDERLVRRL